jgi:hypothetical protein
MISEALQDPYENFIARWRAAGSDKERALLEQELWQTLPPEARVGKDRRSWLASATGDSARAVESRLAVFGEPEAAELWERIERDQMPLTTARERLKEAHILAATTGVSLAAAVTVRLQDYDTWPLHRTKRGQPFRKRPPTRFRSLSAPSKPQVLDETASGGSDRGFWSRLRPQLAEFAASRLKGADPIIAERLYREFERDLKVLFDEFQSRLFRLRSQAKTEQMLGVTIKFAQVQAACLALCMDPPTRGQPANLDVARVKKKKLARVYHPDVTGGDEGTRAKYEETLNAYSVLEDYNEQLNRTEL